MTSFVMTALTDKTASISARSARGTWQAHATRSTVAVLVPPAIGVPCVTTTVHYSTSGQTAGICAHVSHMKYVIMFPDIAFRFLLVNSRS